MPIACLHRRSRPPGHRRFAANRIHSTMYPQAASVETQPRRQNDFRRPSGALALQRRAGTGAAGGPAGPLILDPWVRAVSCPQPEGNARAPAPVTDAPPRISQGCFKIRDRRVQRVPPACPHAGGGRPEDRPPLPGVRGGVAFRDAAPDLETALRISPPVLHFRRLQTIFLSWLPRHKS